MRLPSLNIFEKYAHIDPGGPSLPRPQPSDWAFNFFGEQESLFFVEVGAYDGVGCSNCLLFEEAYNWDGICIEPHPESFRQLEINRPRPKKYNLGLSSTGGTLEFWQVNGSAASLSGFKDFFDDDHESRIYEEIEKHGGDVEKKEIESVRLEDLLKENNIKRINYLSIDAEGADFDILESINFDEVAIDFISCERSDSPEQIYKVAQFLASKGFLPAGWCCADIFYWKPLQQHQDHKKRRKGGRLRHEAQCR